MDKRKRQAPGWGEAPAVKTRRGVGFRRAASRTDEAGNYSRSTRGRLENPFLQAGMNANATSGARKARVVAFHVLPLNVPAPTLLGD